MLCVKRDTLRNLSPSSQRPRRLAHGARRTPDATPDPRRSTAPRIRTTTWGLMDHPLRQPPKAPLGGRQRCRSGGPRVANQTPNESVLRCVVLGVCRGPCRACVVSGTFWSNFRKDGVLKCVGGVSEVCRGCVGGVSGVCRGCVCRAHQRQQGGAGQDRRARWPAGAWAGWRRERAAVGGRRRADGVCRV